MYMYMYIDILTLNSFIVFWRFLVFSSSFLFLSFSLCCSNLFSSFCLFSSSFIKRFSSLLNLKCDRRTKFNNHMVWKEIWNKTKKSNISKTGEATSTKIGLHAFHVNLYMHEFLRQFYFLTPMDYSPWSEREIWMFLKVAISPKPERSRPPKLVRMHVTLIPTCMIFLSQFRSIKFFNDHGL